MISIVSITKNDFKGIINTLRSTIFLRKSNSLIEQIIIDSSDDDTCFEIKKAVNEESGCSYHYFDTNGRSSAFNYGISLCKNDWVWFLNGGDIFYKSNFNLLNLISETHADVVIFQIILSNTNKIKKHPYIWDMWPPIPNWIPHQAVLIRKKILNKYGPYNENYNIAMDGDFWLKTLGKDVSVDVVSIPIAVFDVNGISSKNMRLVSYESMLILIKNSRNLFSKYIFSLSKPFRAIYFFIVNHISIF